MSSEQYLTTSDEELLQKSLEHKVNKHTKQLNQKGWNEIMEDSIKINKRSQLRSRSVAIAASVLVVIAALSVIILTRINTNSTVKTIDKQKNDNVETTTTLPSKSAESKLFGKLLQLKPIGTKDQYGNQRITDFELYNTETNELVAKIQKPSAVAGIEIAKVTNQAISFYAYNSDGPTGNNFTYLIPENKVIDTGKAIRVYSPNNSKYVEFQNGLNPDSPSDITVVSNNTRRVLKPEGSKYISDITWFNENEFAMAIPYDGSIAEQRLADLRKPISIENSKVILSGSLETNLTDAIEVNGQKYILTLTTVNTSDQNTNGVIKVINLTNNKEIHSQNVGPINFNTVQFAIIAKFQGNENSIIYNDGSQALTKNFTTDFILQPNTPFLITTSK